MAATKFRIHKDDVVVVIAGKNKGRTGKILKVDTSTSRVVVEGVNIVKRHVRKNGDQPGKILEVEAPIHVSNVALWDPNSRKALKTRVQVTEQGNVRVNKKTGEKV